MKKHFMFIMFISVFLVLAACGTDTEGDTEDTTTGNDESPVVENNEGSTDDDSETPTEAEDQEDEEDQSNDESENTNEDVMTETGIYNGQADPHTIEIETDEGPTAFQLTMEARDDVEDLTVDQEVTYTYYEDGEQLVIESIQPTE